MRYKNTQLTNAPQHLDRGFFERIIDGVCREHGMPEKMPSLELDRLKKKVRSRFKKEIPDTQLRNGGSRGGHGLTADAKRR